MAGSRAKSLRLIEIGERIRNCRQENHLSQEAFAEQVGVSTNTVSRIEGGQTAMSVEIFAKMVRVLGTDAGELLGEQVMESDSKKKLDKLLFRIGHLRKGDQEIVIGTIEALIDGFYRREYQ